MNDRISSLSLCIEKLKKEQEKFIQFRMSGINNKNLKFADKNVLKNYSITQFKMVGFFRGGFIEKKWALLKLPNKHFYKVEVNDELGLERGHVIFIDEKRIIINGMDNKKIELNLNN
ncbi:pilus assembly protein PilP [Candidatus Rickettsiella viridis]|uniref:pilus assembly protein PilP n=1 Tax=Candidatus Rickettsiella viridis TaxID=676208 RepID=UPI001559C686|nr:pilus assembly protein PilP [Candidatus Rickettsiella viridis]